MALKRISVGQLGSMLTDTVAIDRYSGELVFFSAVSYSTLMQASIKELNKIGSFFHISGMGTAKIAKQGYEIESKKEAKSDYVHTVAYARDKINYKEDGTEEISLFIYCQDINELTDKLYEKTSKYSSVPLLEEWKDYLLIGLEEEKRVRRINLYTSDDSVPFIAYRIDFDKEIIKKIILRGLREKRINIKGNNEASPVLAEIRGLNDYLNGFGEILAEKIQTAFKPKFIPGEDQYDTFTNYIDDYMYHEANIELFEAQKSVIQAVVNDLRTNDATFMIAEMGSGNYVSNF